MPSVEDLGVHSGMRRTSERAAGAVPKANVQLAIGEQVNISEARPHQLQAEHETFALQQDHSARGAVTMVPTCSPAKALVRLPGTRPLMIWISRT